MTTKSWRLIARPHRDVLEGSFRQAEFAADISRVAAGTAEQEYQNAEQFFKRTFITEGMRDLLVSVAQRLTGKSGDPVIQLQTNFGGGKTHTLLAVYHLAKQEVSPQKMDGIPSLLDEAGILELPKARVAVIDGISLSPNQPITRDGLDIWTMWGLLAHALLGKEGYDMVADSDRSGTAPGKEVIIELLRKAAPCVVLMDEVVAFLRQLDDSKHLTAGTLAANMSFIQALTEGMKAVPNAILLASLPESDAETVGTQGKKALTSLEKYFGRVESVWKPVAQNESFEIVRRRLFDTTGVEHEVDEVCREFADFYRANKDRLPSEVQESRYYEKLRHSYPIHPEIFDRLYEDWSTLDKFQRTRGVLQYMAIVIHRLWQDNDQDPMIMPGSLPLHDMQVRVKSTQYLPQGWDVVITKEIDGEDSQSAAIDKDPRFGALQAAHRVARTAFLGSAPGNAAQSARGIHKERILLGCGRPGDSLSTYEDVFSRLRDNLHYLFSSDDRYWFDTHPNLRKEMEARKEKVDHSQVLSTLKGLMESKMGKNTFFSAQHVFTPVRDIPDEIGSGVRLVLLQPDSVYSYSKAAPDNTFKQINAILGVGTAGASGMVDIKQRLYKNRVVFLAPDSGVIERVIDQCRSYLAWCEIGAEMESGRLNLDALQIKNVKQEKEASFNHLGSVLMECYKHLIVPTAEDVRNMRLEVRAISCRGGKLADVVRDALVDNEYVVKQYSPLLLKQYLDLYYFSKGRAVVSVDQLWKDMCMYYYFQRLQNIDVLRETISNGVASGDFFGYATGQEGDNFLGFVYGAMPATIYADSASVIIEKTVAQAYKAKLESAKPVPQPPTPGPSPEPGNDGHTSGGNGPVIQPTPTPIPGGSPAPVQALRRYYGSIELDPVNPESTFHDVVAEIVSLFTKKINVGVKLRLEIEAETKDLIPFDAPTVRAVKENANALNLNESDFYEN